MGDTETICHLLKWHALLIPRARLGVMSLGHSSVVRQVSGGSQGGDRDSPMTRAAHRGLSADPQPTKQSIEMTNPPLGPHNPSASPSEVKLSLSPR
jgi:hypothetical protein